jgi:8-oxo-dGTP pyrophosphatase MutT (NUDIX family)
MSARDLRLISVFGARRSNGVYRPSQLRKLNRNEQVAAVCFRVGKHGIEFLLVRTGGGRWTFPKGCTEPGLTHAQAAAVEAFEEAGVHGRMEEASFARYTHRKGAGRNSEGREVLVHAHLCEVVRLSRPKEDKRRPTWFSVEKTKYRLQENRKHAGVWEMMRMVDLARARIERLGRACQRERLLPQVKVEALDFRFYETPFATKGNKPRQHVTERRWRIPLLTSGNDVDSEGLETMKAIGGGSAQRVKGNSSTLVRKMPDKRSLRP